MALEHHSNVLVLLSGGIDSSACISFYLKQNFKVSALNIDYGHLSKEQETRAASDIASYYHIPLRFAKYDGRTFQHNGLINGRNAFFLMAALLEFDHRSGIIAIGVHSGTHYIDCSELFIRNMQRLFDLYNDGRIIVGVPFLNWDKRQIWDYCTIERIPIHLTYSCELGRKQPCGICRSCKDLEALDAFTK